MSDLLNIDPGCVSPTEPRRLNPDNTWLSLTT
jgi:hypothetical protein